MSEGIDLTKLWNKTDGVRHDGFVFLRVKSVDAPASYLTNDQWFVTCKRLQEGVWEVGLRGGFLPSLPGPHKIAAKQIFEAASSLEPSEIFTDYTHEPVIQNNPDIISDLLKKALRLEIDTDLKP